MRVLVACEESQRVTIEFRSKGHEAYSCDIIGCSGNHPEWHIRGDAIELLNGNCTFLTEDGILHTINGKWDMIIAFPPCTYLTNTGNRWFDTNKYGESAVRRWDNRREAAEFFMRFVNANCDRIVIENPVGIMSQWYKKPTQVIHPYMFAESITDKANYVTKRTCLWIKGVSPLKTNSLPKPNNGELFGFYSNGKPKCWEETRRLARERSKTFPAVAVAMATQWG